MRSWGLSVEGSGDSGVKREEEAAKKNYGYSSPSQLGIGSACINGLYRIAQQGSRSFSKNQVGRMFDQVFGDGFTA